jgi:PAS domain S-box-containing protein
LELSAPRTPAAPAGVGWRLIGFNLLMLALLAALVALSQSASRRNFVERAEVATENIVAALAQSIQAELDRVDIGLRNVALDLEPDFSAGAPDAARVEALLAQQLALLPQLESIRIADAAGVVRYGRGVAGAPRVEVVDRDYFIEAREGNQPGPAVSGPMLARISNKWVVAVARPLRDARGGFAGVVYANVGVEHFARLLEGVDLGRQGAITVRGTRLGLVARRSADGAGPAELGSSNVSAQFQRVLAERPDAGRFVARTALDGIERVNAYRRVGATPMLVLAGLATDDFLEAWRVQTREMVAMAMLAMAVLVATSLLLQRAWAGQARSAQALIREGERHGALLRAAGDGMHVVDRQGRLVEMSDSFAAMLGYPREELLGKPVTLWDAQLTAQEIERRLQSFRVGELVRFNSRHRRADGRLIDVEVVSLGVRIEEEDLLYCSSRDVTERRAQARELERYRDHLETLVAERTEQWRASEVRFRALAEQSLVGVYVQVKNEYRFVNEAFAAIFGYDDPQDMMNGRLRAHTLIAPEELDHVNEVSRRVIAGEEPMTRLEFTGVRRDGRRVTLETFACPIQDAEGPSAIGLLLDVTAQRQAEAERAAALVREQGLRAAAEQRSRELRELLEQRDEFVRVLAHEVRQPLNNASAALQSALAGLPAAGGAAERIVRAQGVIRQIVASLDNTLAATSLLASSKSLDSRDADVGALIDLSLGDLDEARRSRVRVERISPTRTASMDIGLMRLALRNVLGNALAYSPPDSEVVLRVVDSDEPLALVFEVADLGPGIPDELRPRLFERGARGSHGVPGHGIGLHVVRRVMELHGGSVDVRPHTPRGTVFRLWLPQGQ